MLANNNLILTSSHSYERILLSKLFTITKYAQYIYAFNFSLDSHYSTARRIFQISKQTFAKNFLSAR